MEKDTVERLQDLENEVSALRAKVNYLAGKVEDNGINEETNINADNSNPKDKLNNYKPKTRFPAVDFSVKEGLEQLIGGKVLNRLGIVILLFGTAYFLKYAFDNQWIGEIGRIIIGLVAGMGLMIAGDMLVKRKYHFFSQGLTGAGIAVIYLTAYAAANLYDIFSPAIALGLLVLTAVAGGLLSVRQDAFAVAVLSTLGGFMSPFLIGSDSSNTLFLFSYLAILDFVVLYLAFHKNWCSLNFLSFIGTALAYTAYNVGGYSDTYMNQVFLVLYFVIFGALAFLYNVRHKKATTLPDILLMSLNAGFFITATIENLFKYSDMHGLITVLLASVYLVVSLTLHKRGLGDNQLFYSMLGIGLTLVTVAIPLQLDKEWCNIAWAVEALVLVYGGLKNENIWVSRSGVAVLVLASMYQFSLYVSKLYPVINSYSISFLLITAGFFFTYYMFNRSNHVDRKIAWPAAVYGVILTLKYISWEVINVINYFELSFDERFAISLAWVAIAVVLTVFGVIKDNKGFRFISFGIFGIVLCKILLLDLSMLTVALRVMILLIMGAILVGVSFVYQRDEKKVEK